MTKNENEDEKKSKSIQPEPDYKKAKNSDVINSIIESNQKHKEMFRKLAE